MTSHAETLTLTGFSRDASRFSIELASAREPIAAYGAAVRARAGTPFQQQIWLRAWCAAFGSLPGVEPLVVTAIDRVTGEVAIVLWLISRKIAGIQTVEFADLGVTDYNAPALGAAAPTDSRTAAILWRDVCEGLSGVDLVRFQKMPTEVNGRPNPLALVACARPCKLNGNLVTVRGDFDAYRYSLKRTFRKELERSWRVLTRHADSRFQAITDVDQALQLFDVMEQQQGERLRQLGPDFQLNDEAHSGFYRHLVREGLPSGFVVVTALTVGRDIVATLLGVRNGDRYVMLRHSHAGERWSNCSPGRLIVARTMAHLHAEGVRHFDFSLGNYPHKRRFGVTRLPLFDLTVARTWRGLPGVVRDAAVRGILRYPVLANAVRGAMGKPMSREEA